jgi:N-acetylglutamate synthase-like GNAT family acetyltransferase
MKIIDLAPEHEQIYFCCLEDWSEELKEAGDHKKNWVAYMKDKGLRVKLAVDENGVVGGMIQYVPIEHSMIAGKDLYVVLCIWVHGYKQGRGNFRGLGMGKALLHAAEEDCRQLNAAGLVTWGLIIPVFMRASWFKKHGYKTVDKNGMMRLLWKPFSQDVQTPHFIKPVKRPEKGKGKVNVTIFCNGWCPAMNMTYERALRASKEFEDKVAITQYKTTDAAIRQEWGIFDGLYIDGKEVRTGPPPSFKKIRRKIAKRVK